MERLEKRSDVAEYGRFRNCSSLRVENELKTIKLRLGKVQKKRVSVIELLVYERFGNSVRSGLVKSFLYSAELTVG